MPAITGKTGKNGVRARTKQSEEEKNIQRLAQVEKVLLTEATRKRGKVDAGKIAAAKAIYDKLRPSLSAVEQHNMNEQDLVTADQIVSALESIVAQRPQLVDHLIAIRDKQRLAEGNSQGNTDSTTH